jgi:hypothetical protein
MLVIFHVSPWSYPDEVWTRFTTRAFVPELGYIGAVRSAASYNGKTIKIPPYTRWDLTTPDARQIPRQGE